MPNDGWAPGWGHAKELCSQEDLHLMWGWSFMRDEMMFIKTHYDHPEVCPCSRVEFHQMRLEQAALGAML